MWLLAALRLVDTGPQANESPILLDDVDDFICCAPRD
jgi:hypothetical protein